MLQNPQCRLPAYADFDVCRKMILSELHSNITVITAKECKLERKNPNSVTSHIMPVMIQAQGGNL